MNLLKHIAFFGLALFVLMGSAGFYVFEHSCKIDGSDAHIYLAEQHVCGAEQAADSCCHSSESEEQDKDCCEDEVKVFQTSYGYYHCNDQPQFLAEWSCVHHLPCFAFEVRTATFTNDVLPNGPPFTRSGRSISVQHQVFRC